ncbi:MAG: hypothetical protein SGPRY_001419 [Prymnesium sp.]
MQPLLLLALNAHAIALPTRTLVRARSCPPRMFDPASALIVIESPVGIAATAAGCVGAAVVAARRRSSSVVDEVARSSPIKHEMSIGDLLREYGVIALLFHFSVWCLTIAAAVSALSLAGPENLSAIPMLPADLFLADQPAVTPVISEKAREYEAVRNLEEAAWSAANRVATTAKALLPPQKDDQ